MLRLKSSTQVVTHGYRRFHTKIKKIYTAFTNSDSENKKQTNKQTNKHKNNNDNKDERRASTTPV